MLEYTIHDTIQKIDMAAFDKHLIQRVKDLRKIATKNKPLVISTMEINIDIYESLYGPFPVLEDTIPVEQYVQ